MGDSVMAYCGIYSLQPQKNHCLETDTPIRFNYLGQTEQLFTESAWLTPANESTGASRSPDDRRDVLIEINAVVSKHQLTLHWTYSPSLHQEETVIHWAKTYLTELKRLIEYCLSTKN